MATAAQIAANRENAKHSTGAVTEAGHEASSRNNFRHGLTGHAFVFLDFEDPDRYELILTALRGEHQPTTPTEEILIEKMAQHHWLSQRVLYLQTVELEVDIFNSEADRTVAKYIRYQAHYDRLFQRALHDLLKLRAERRKAEIGFESQKRAEAQETRRENDETRKQKLHDLKLAAAETKLERERALTANVNSSLRAATAPCESPQPEKMAA